MRPPRLTAPIVGPRTKTRSGADCDQRGAHGGQLVDPDRVVVATGNPKAAAPVDARTGRLLETYAFPTAGFINDLAITRTAVYATDSNNRHLAVIPLGFGGRLKDPNEASLLPLTGDFVVIPGQFNANGIVAKGNFLIMVQGNEGKLFRVDPKAGDTRLINTSGYSLTNGDGLALRDGRLYVVRNQSNLVAVFTLGSDLLNAALVGEITSPRLDVPTTATFALNKLWVVNARFGTTPTPTTPYWITQLPTSP